ncbi:hypothetical protein FRX31_006231, partial [Thalictrum thalictroides]
KPGKFSAPVLRTDSRLREEGGVCDFSCEASTRFIFLFVGASSCVTVDLIKVIYSSIVVLVLAATSGSEID